jgi:hypothetical protein
LSIWRSCAWQHSSFWDTSHMYGFRSPTIKVAKETPGEPEPTTQEVEWTCDKATIEWNN